MSISWRLASAADVLAAIDQFYGYELSIDGIIQEIETGQIDMASLSQGQGGYSHPVVRLVDALLSDAVHKLASGHPPEPEGQFLRIRYRIDGVLRQVRVLHGRYWNAMLVRLKLVAGMNIAESRAPQDGRVSLSIGGRSVDFRAAVQPTIHGENFVLRVLDAKRGIVEYRKLGLTEDQYYLLDLMLARPEGIILVTGPTGSGKTTTLYSVLSHMNDEERQHHDAGGPGRVPHHAYPADLHPDGSKIDFSDGVRSLMRQDPDIILVGEVRDKDTAEMAFRAAMTGHQVSPRCTPTRRCAAFQRIKGPGRFSRGDGGQHHRYRGPAPGAACACTAARRCRSPRAASKPASSVPTPSGARCTVPTTAAARPAASRGTRGGWPSWNCCAWTACWTS